MFGNEVGTERTEREASGTPELSGLPSALSRIYKPTNRFRTGSVAVSVR